VRSLLAICFHAGILFGYSTLKMEALCSSEKSVEEEEEEDVTVLYP
jgi:hypothetical protein